ncbi:hypothetical protein ACFX13_047798 [Malus domestica]|uniref:lecithin-cholesterol acyltransferase-like 1 n=1 Tax=Malus domestica TaxID=3750 RepID=UPI003974BA39
MKPPLGLKLLLVFSSMVLMLYKCQAGATNLHPLILIPGNGGNQLEARLTTDYKPSGLLYNRWYPFQKKNDGWFRLWFDPTVLIAPFTSCFAQLMTLYYDAVSDDYHNALESRLGSLTLVPLSHFSTLIPVSRTDSYGVTTGSNAPYQLRSCHR